MRRKEKREKSCSSHTVSFLSLLSDSHGPRTENIKSIENLNDMRLEIVAASLPRFFST
jgi:hypothetical protein